MKFEKSSERCMSDAHSIEDKLSKYPLGHKLTRDMIKEECKDELSIDERMTLNIWLSMDGCTWSEKTICYCKTIQIGFVKIKV